MTSKFIPDPSLIRYWSDETAATQPLEGPYVSLFERDGSQVHYIAAHHGGDIDSPTLKTVKKEFDEFRPDVVIIEGVPNEGQRSPAWFLDYARESAERNFARGGEGAYAALLASERKIEFVPGEPTAKELLDGLHKQGFTTQDYLGWEVAGMIKVRHADGEINDANADRFIERCAQNALSRLGLREVTFTGADFRGWYKDRMGKPCTLEGAAADNGAPSCAADANFMQRFMDACDRVREPHILNTIAAEASAHARVLVVYGSGHEIKQEPALAKMLGKPRHVKAF